MSLVQNTSLTVSAQHFLFIIHTTRDLSNGHNSNPRTWEMKPCCTCYCEGFAPRGLNCLPNCASVNTDQIHANNSRVKQAPRMSDLFNLTLKIFRHQQVFWFFPCIRKVQDIGNRFQHPTILIGQWGRYLSLCYLFYFRKQNVGTSYVCPNIALPIKTVMGEKLEQTFPCAIENLWRGRWMEWKWSCPLPCIPILLSGPHMHSWCKGFPRFMPYLCCETGKHQVLELSDPTFSVTF